MKSALPTLHMTWCRCAALLLPLLAGCGTPGSSPSPTNTVASSPAKTLWPAPKNALALTRKAGLVPERHETLLYHVHAHLDVFVNGQKILVPAGVGINIHDPGVQHGQTAQGPAYGGIRMCRRPCISPLHTHDTTGVLHTESANTIPHRLGQFFTEWGIRLSSRCVDGFCSPRTKVAVYVNGKPITGDPKNIQLLDQREIAVVVGKPPAHIPSTPAG